MSLPWQRARRDPRPWRERSSAGRLPSLELGHLAAHDLADLGQRARLELAHPLARDAEVNPEILECGRLVAQLALDQDLALARGERIERRREDAAALRQLVGIREPHFLIRRVIDKEVLPLRIAVDVETLVEGGVAAAHAAAHVEHLG